MICTGWGDRPFSISTIAAAAILAWLFAMLPDFGMPGPDSVASPSTCTPLTAFDSIVRQSTSHQRLLVVMSPACRAIVPAPCGGTTLSTSPFTSSTSSFTVIVFASTPTALALPRYSMTPPYKSFHAALNRPGFEVTSGFASSTSTFDFGFACLKYAATMLARSYGPGGQRYGATGIDRI